MAKLQDQDRQQFNTPPHLNKNAKSTPRSIQPCSTYAGGKVLVFFFSLMLFINALGKRRCYLLANQRQLDSLINGQEHDDRKIQTSRMHLICLIKAAKYRYQIQKP